MRRRILAVLAVLAIGGTLLAACKPSAPAQPEARPDPADAPAAAEAASAPVPAVQMQAVEPDLARALNAEIDAQGAGTVIAALGRNPARFRQVRDAIATADPVWLTIALRLREGSDAGTGEALGSALALALPDAPERVLALVGHGYTIANLCTSPFIEPAAGVAEAYAAKATAALQSVTDPALNGRVEECLKRIARQK